MIKLKAEQVLLARLFLFTPKPPLPETVILEVILLTKLKTHQPESAKHSHI